MKIDEIRLSKLIFTARKRKGFTQAYISKETGITQGTLSKIESGVCSVSAKHWFLLSKLLDIPSESVWSGLIDRGIKPARETEKNTYKLPKKYYQNAHSSVKEIISILEYVQRKEGVLKFEAYLAGLGIPEYFFYDLNNKINFLFAVDLLNHFYPGKVDEKLYEEIAELSKEEVFHGVHSIEYKKKNTALNLLKAYIDNASYYQDGYKYKIVKRNNESIEFVLESTSAENDQFEDILIPFKKAYLKSLTKMDDNSSLNFTVSKQDSTYTFKATTVLS
ncbi:helix-turn-helix domain-containing protein [Halobacteriovorax sp. HLS]|uniref:helix-turn-helix domain-containing protein n=1 Tax=Halobacteriovorax sp. HLS TaxID=2234000 RepID=UPI0013E3D77B|nr:helix-turn-helix transcriptional regulator [Halobacteriovorax sp. HLS]